MRKLVAGAAFAWVFSALPCWAQQIDASAPSPQDAVRQAEQAATEAEYWANEAARAALQDPRTVARQRSAFRRANRIERLEARKWTLQSASRPVTVVNTVFSRPLLPYSAWYYGPYWYHDHNVWGGSVLGHAPVGYVESSRAPALGIFGGWRTTADRR